jgi:phage-related protein
MKFLNVRLLRTFGLPVLTAGTFIFGLSLVPTAAQTTPPPQITRGELTNFDEFLDRHPILDGELRRNPSLADDPNYLAQHPELNEFLSHHPGVKGQLAAEPGYFMRREERFQGREPVTSGELRGFDNFLDRHSVLDAEVRRNPSLLHNPNYLSSHPELAQYLREHPGIDGELESHPRYFMHREMGFQAAKGITGGEVRSFDNFLDQHPDVERDLNRNPRLINNPKYIENHPELHSYLNSHPNVDGAIQSRPGRFMARERRHERHENEGPKAAPVRTTNHGPRGRS